MAAFCRQEAIDLVVFGPEKQLVEGWTDFLRATGIACFGPSSAAARLEGSKSYAKEVMKAAGVPTAQSKTFDDFTDARAAAAQHSLPLVIKADGLAAGKGVTICQTLLEAETALRAAMLEDKFGAAGRRVVIEEFLVGREASFHVLCDGTRVLPLEAAQDHKTLFEGGKGPNTGGMGTFAPSPFVTHELRQTICSTIAEPVIAYMASQGCPFQGVLFIGLMLTWHGPKVLEFNVRFGDPETQVLMPLIEGDLLPILAQAAAGSFDSQTRLDSWKQRHAVCVVACAAGYPDQPTVGDEITLPSAGEDCQIFHAGTRLAADGTLLTAGGRVLGVTAWRASLDSAHHAAYRLMDRLHFQGRQFRKDIGVLD
jgi:phosphoribosylamine--glycine ligase